MPRAEMMMVFSYDVSDNKRRRRIAKRLEDRMARVQKSVFEARINRRDADALARSVAGLLGPGDSLRVYAIGDAGLKRSHVYGAGIPFEGPEGYWIV